MLKDNTNGRTKLLVLHGPNLNLLGMREPDIYGTLSLAEINSALKEEASEHNVELRIVQSNNEGALIDEIHASRDWAAGIIINAGAYTHTSIAIGDAVAAIKIPVIEVHISNIEAREEFRKYSHISAKCSGTIFGFGLKGYELAVQSFLV